MGFWAKLFGFSKTDEKKQEKKQSSENSSTKNADSIYAKELSAKEEEIEKLCKKLNSSDAKIKDLEQTISSLSSNSSSGTDIDAAVAKLTDQLKKLKKEKDDLEEELEDSEDDLKKSKKKLQECEQERDEAISNNKKLEGQIRNLADDLQHTQDELKQKQDESKLRGESLEFVHEILTAPESKESSMVELYRQVDDIENYILEEFHDCVKAGYTPNDSWDYYFNTGLAQWSAIAKKHWIQGKTTIAFVGEFSAGKTSIVNRILSQDDPSVPQLPVSAKATTAIPTYISGGPAATYNFVSPNNSYKRLSEKTFKMINKEVLDQIDGISALISYFVMTYKNPNLNSLSILDTPGFNSQDERDAERTISVINECDALFWVIDVNAGEANRTSLELIKGKLNKPLFVVINKVDTKAPSEVDKVEQKVKKSFSDAGVPVQGYVRFSGSEPLSVIMNAIKSVRHSAEGEEYLYRLENDFLPDLVGVYSDEVKSQNADYQEKAKAAEELSNEFFSLAQETVNRSAEAASIPHFENHWFRKDGYEMSINDYNRMTSLLDQIANSDINTMWQQFQQYGDAMQDTQLSYGNLADTKAAYQRICKCRDVLKQKIKALKKA